MRPISDEAFHSLAKLIDADGNLIISREEYEGIRRRLFPKAAGFQFRWQDIDLTDRRLRVWTQAPTPYNDIWYFIANKHI